MPLPMLLVAVGFFLCVDSGGGGSSQGKLGCIHVTGGKVSAMGARGVVTFKVPHFQTSSLSWAGSSS